MHTPRPSIQIIDAIALIVGIVVGAGIFRTPSLVATYTGSPSLFLVVWGLGALVSLVGALCYAELSTAFPNTGGEYHFLTRAFGSRFAFLFAWARMSIIQTGSIALLAYIVGDYLTQLYSLGQHSSALYAASVVTVLTVINVWGVRIGTGTQKLLFVIELIGITGVIIAAFLSPPATPPLSDFQGTSAPSAAMGLAMVFVLLTYGGWNEAGYLSAELHAGSRKMVYVMIVSILIISAIYLIINSAFLYALGMDGLASSEAVGIDLMRITWGEPGVIFIGFVVVMAALTSVNATIFTGARSIYALGRDFTAFEPLGKWNTSAAAPVNALLLQGFIALALVVLGAFTRNGFQSMVDFTAPVFWFFFLATGVALFTLRVKEPRTPRPFKVPFYPIIPAIFCASCGYLLYSSLAFTGVGALVGVAVLLLGTLFFITPNRKVTDRDQATEKQ